MVFGQVVIGAPGSGKTTYCNSMSQFLNLVGRSLPTLRFSWTSGTFFSSLKCQECHHKTHEEIEPTVNCSAFD
ncbi:unnamed protein product [Lupinus luteus]|uniref:Uncharacterized protein n=1 Tax=Lupinus luteus TaxID=3873 RepID=A0AAV1WAM2_LUPLU